MSLFCSQQTVKTLSCLSTSSLGKGLNHKANKILKKSVEYALNHRDEPINYIKQHSQELSDEVINQHIALYVNNYSFVHKDWFGFTCHRLVASKFQLAFKNVIDRNLANKIKTFGGYLNKRSMRGGNTWSMHSWGIAIDLNAQWNQFGQKNFEMSEDLARCFEDVGFVWGGRWIGSFDAMHFQYATIR